MSCSNHLDIHSNIWFVSYDITVRRMVSENTSLMFSVLPCEAVPALGQITSPTDLPLISWTSCIGYPPPGNVVSMTSPLITVQTVIKRLVLRLKWRRLVFIYDHLSGMYDYVYMQLNMVVAVVWCYNYQMCASK